MTRETKPKTSLRGLDRIEMCGFKSISSPIGLDIRPLTLIAGTNSSGKSSAMQVLLILKQTLESSFDPGPLQIYGNNIQFTDLKQIFSSQSIKDMKLDISLFFDGNRFLTAKYKIKHKSRDIIIDTFIYGRKSHDETALKRDGKDENLSKFKEFDKFMSGIVIGKKTPSLKYTRDRCFLIPEAHFDTSPSSSNTAQIARITLPAFEVSRAKEIIMSIIHLPGLRGNPERIYPLTMSEERYPGKFENYVAGIIWKWQSENSREFSMLREYLLILELTGDVKAKRVTDAGIELYVSRNKTSTGTMVSIADVGLGVSQILPILVAIIQAKRGQVVFVEQPEIHLHPKAQSNLAAIFAKSIAKGVKLVIETHSSNLLLAIQTAVAKGELDNNDVKLHWFTKNSEGTTQVSSADLDTDGSFGDWPEDFDDTLLEQQDAYLSAIENQMAGKG